MADMLESFNSNLASVMKMKKANSGFLTKKDMTTC